MFRETFQAKKISSIDETLTGASESGPWSTPGQ